MGRRPCDVEQDVLNGYLTALEGSRRENDDGDRRRRSCGVLQSRFATPFTLVDRCSKSTPKTATSAILGDLRRGLQVDRQARQHGAAS